MGKAKAFVTVIEGCNHSCTFCIVPTTRGREISREMDVVLDEVRSLAAQGIAEVEFLGQTVNAYRDSRGRSLADLLLAASEVEGIRRIRFTTSHPAQMTERLMDAMVAAPAVVPYLHLPVQSGSSRVLRDMKRGYDREGYLRKVEALRRRRPAISLGTDFIVGFPTETAGDFQESLTLLDEVGFDTVYSFTYSRAPAPPPRTGPTPSARPASSNASAFSSSAKRRFRLAGTPPGWDERSRSWWKEAPNGTRATGPGEPPKTASSISAATRRRAGSNGSGSPLPRPMRCAGSFRGRALDPTRRAHVYSLFRRSDRRFARSLPGRFRSMPVRMKVKGLMIDPVSNMPIIVLKDPDGESVLPIWVGIFEANAIAMQLEKIVSPRP